MVTTLEDRRVADALDRLYGEASEQTTLLNRVGVAAVTTSRQAAQRVAILRQRLRERRARIGSRRPLLPRNATSQERADALSSFSAPVTPEAGRLLYALVRATRPNTVIEFGMSYGISTIHLASAVRDNGRGHIYTTELSTAKVSAAKSTFTEIRLDDLITVLDGDALTTLANVDSSVDFVLLDGWKELYLPVLRLLEPHLLPGSLIVADNTDMADIAPYLDYVRNADNGYVSVNFLVGDSDGMEISCRATPIGPAGGQSGR